MYQKMEQEGSWADDLADGNPAAGYVIPGNQTVAHFREEYADDEWYQMGLTVEGSIGDWDVVYSGNYLDRDFEGSFDYSEYSYWYNVAYTYFASLYLDNDGERRSVDPSMSFSNDDQYKKTSHEIRISSPQENRVRGLLGFFYQKQEHDFYQEFGRLEGLADVGACPTATTRTRPERVPGRRVPEQHGPRGHGPGGVRARSSFDVTDTLELSVGARYFEPEVTVKGFFGFGLGLNPYIAPVSQPGLPPEPGDPAERRRRCLRPPEPVVELDRRMALPVAGRRTAAGSRPARTSTRASRRATASTAST